MELLLGCKWPKRVKTVVWDLRYSCDVTDGTWYFPICNRVRKWRHNFRIWISRDPSGYFQGGWGGDGNYRSAGPHPTNQKSACLFFVTCVPVELAERLEYSLPDTGNRVWWKPGPALYRSCLANVSIVAIGHARVHTRGMMIGYMYVKSLLSFLKNEVAFLAVTIIPQRLIDYVFPP
jgi:hypothetical protein